MGFKHRFNIDNSELFMYNISTFINRHATELLRNLVRQMVLRSLLFGIIRLKETNKSILMTWRVINLPTKTIALQNTKNEMSTC